MIVISYICKPLIIHLAILLAEVLCVSVFVHVCVYVCVCMHIPKIYMFGSVKEILVSLFL